MFQQNQLEDVRTNITVWLTSMAIQVNKLKKLNHVLDEEYQITHILASLPREYSSVVEQVKIDRRTDLPLITMDDVMKRLKERYLQLKREHGWSEDEMALNVKSGNNPNKNVKKGSKGNYFKGRCNHCGKFGHKKADCWDLKNKKEKHQENEKKVQKDKSKVRCFKCGKLGHYASECKNDRESSGDCFKGRCNHCGKFGHKKADCWDLKNKKEKHQENEKKVQKDKSKVRCFKCGKLGHYASECKNDRESSGDGNNETFAMMCYENTEDDKNGNVDSENNQESKNSEDYERNVGPFSRILILVFILLWDILLSYFLQ